MPDDQTISRIAVGLDLGQVADYTALAVVERTDVPRLVETVYNVRRFERLPLGTSYPDITRHVRDLFRDPRLQQAQLVVDAMGCGAPVVDMLVSGGLSPVAVRVHGGSEETWDERFRTWHIPKRALVFILVKLFQKHVVKVAARSAQLEALEKELKAYRIKISPGGHDSYEAWRESDHDDLVFALGLACWWLDRHTPMMPTAVKSKSPRISAHSAGY